MRPLLARANMVYQAGFCPEELDVVAGVFAEALEGEDEESVRRAFALHVKNSKRFPTPAHIVELLPECRVRHVALAEQTRGTITPGYGARLWAQVKARRDDTPMDVIIAETQAEHGLH